MKYCQTCRHCYEDAEALCPRDGAALAEARPGTRLLAGAYQLEVFLGRGDIGAAYEATEVRGGRPVIAVELLRGEVLADTQSLERFHQSAQAAGRNNGQEVGEIRDSGPLPGGGAYVVMELIDEGAEGEGDAEAAATGQAGPPPAAAQAPTTGRLRPPGRNTGRLSKVAAELTQEVPRITLPIPPSAAGSVTGSQPTPPFTASDVTREMSAPPQTQAVSAPQTAPGVVTTPSSTIVPGNTREAERGGRSASFYLWVALISLACGVLLAIVVLRLRREPDAAPAEGRPADSQPLGAAPAERQDVAPAAGQTTPDAAPENAMVAGRVEDVSAVLDDWVSAADARDVDRLMAFYSPELDAFYNERSVSSSSIRAELTRLYEGAESVDVRMVTRPRIRLDEGGRGASARVRLGYVIEDRGGRRRRGEAVQELQLAQTAEGWKITGQRGEKMPR